MSFDKSFAHRERLLEAALDEFAATGYQDASINHILDRAGMSKGQFYYHFGNKEGLYLALTDVLVARKRAFLAEVMSPEELQGDIFAIFGAQIRHGLEFARRFPAIQRFSERFLREKGQPIYEKALARHDFGEDALLDQLIARAHAAGDFRSDLPLPFIKRVVAFLFNHAAELAALDRPEAFEAQLGHLISFMESGLARDPDRS